jgi:putative DNA methylase
VTYKKKLIEVALPLDAINRESAREKSIRHGHPSTLHLWWARRPLAAARAVIWSSLVDDPSAHPDRFPTEDDQERERKRLFGILEELVKWENSNDQRVLSAARAEIMASNDGEPPAILDPFCGGGTIPLEAQRLGLKAIGGDLNPVAVLISKAMVEIPPQYAGMAPVNPETRGQAGLNTWEGAQGLAADIRYYGQWMRDRALERLGHSYPNVALPDDQGGGDATVIAWIWARTVKSPDPAWDRHVPLVRSWVLSNKPRKPTVWIEPAVDHSSRSITYHIREGGTPTEGTVLNAQGRCIATGSPIDDEYIKEEATAGRLGEEMIAIVAEGRRSRLYVAPRPDAVAAANVGRPHDPPSITLSTHPQYMGPPRYGMTETSDLFSDRQLTTLMVFSEVLSEVRDLVETDTYDGLADQSKVTSYVNAVVTYLAFAIDRLADRQSTMCSWDSGKEHSRNVFARQAIPMTWDYAENNPFSSSAGNWLNMVEWVAKVVARLPGNPPGVILQRDAGATIQEYRPAVVSTDPPYYAQVPYADISDFFYVWLRHNLRAVWPHELSTLATPKAQELVADEQRMGGRANAKSFFEAGMQRVLSGIPDIQPPQIPATIFYAFKQSEAGRDGSTSTGWETFLTGLLNAGLGVVRTWPVRTELANRPRAIESGALASSIVLVCRPRDSDAQLVTRSDFLDTLRSELPQEVRLLQAESILPVDLAQSAIGPGMAVFSRYSKVIEADGSTMTVRQALALINEVLQEVLSAEETAFDADTRWALTWYEENGMAAGPYGRAHTLSLAKDTSIDGIVDAGLATSREGRVQLVGSEGLPDDWDPAHDTRPTVWELAHHLIKRLDTSESDAAQLLGRVGAGYGDRARQLSYLLFDIAERNGRSKDAVAYNSLIQAWPELSRLAAGPVQTTLGT